MTNQNVCCCGGCDGRSARFAVLVPYASPTSNGAEWTPYARACLPTAESWPTTRLLPVIS